MLKNLFFITICLTANYLVASENVEKPSQIGKYQLVTEKGYLFVLDTETGQIQRGTQGWDEYKWIDVSPPSLAE